MSRQRRIFIFILSGVFFLTGFYSSAQIYESGEHLSWQIIANATQSQAPPVKFLSFDNSSPSAEYPFVGEYIKQIRLESGVSVKAELENELFIELSDAEREIVTFELPQEVKTEAVVRYGAGIPYATVSFLPMRLNPETGKAEKLVSFYLKLVELSSPSESTNPTSGSFGKNAQGSALAAGNWFKIGVTSTGMHKINRDLLNKIGIDPNSVDPRRIKIYGKPGGVLPQHNSIPRDEDLIENAIYIEGENDGKFDGGDFVLFYASGPEVWSPDLFNKTYVRKPNHYCDTAYYFITADGNPGKRIGNRPSIQGNADYEVSSFDDFGWHELEQLTDISKNIKGGRDWYGEIFSSVNSKDPVTKSIKEFSFPHIDGSKPAKIVVNAAGRAYAVGSVSVKVNGAEVLSLAHRAAKSSYPSPYAEPAEKSGSAPIAYFNHNSDKLSVDITYNKPTSDAILWLNYIEVSVRRHLTFEPGQVIFRDINATEAGKIYKYKLTNGSGAEIWDVTDFHDIKRQESALNGGTREFQVSSATQQLREFVAFDKWHSFPAPANHGRVQNQNLHGLDQADMVIVSHSKFWEAANRLADFHRQHDHFVVHVVTPSQIYNEFSSGGMDVTAIRDFMRMFYNRAGANGKKPGYLLLMGDASYDYKDRIGGNTNYVPTYQSNASLDPFSAYASDDYYGFMDDNEGYFDNGAGQGDKMDVAVGRIPVSTLSEANGVVDKIIRYHSPEAKGNWRNMITYVADDEDNNRYVNDCEQVAGVVKSQATVFDITKIYLDAYKQESTSSGDRYPDVNEAIQRRVDAGTLVFTYIGHGQELGIAHEKILSANDIQGWKNSYKMPLLITATCELSRFDDPERTSAGEFALLNKDGGAIGLFTTTRVVYAHENGVLNSYVVEDNLLRKENGKGRRIGDIFITAKNKNGFSVNTRNFILLGDPAVRLAIPEYEIAVTKINGNDPGTDTLKALSLITIEGEVRNNGQIINDYNGVVYPTIYDKEVTKQTLANDAGSSKRNFLSQESVIYKGKATVRNGYFKFSFYVPKDISFRNGNGKLSFYSDNQATDAHGYSNDVVVGGSSPNPVFDDKGPEIHLYMNDKSFKRGGLVDESPVMIAEVTDDLGINTTGSGVGHDITLWVNGGSDPIILNDYYEAVLDNYQMGYINYPFHKLPDGNYKLRLKLWDVNNNSAETTTEFVVANSAKFALDKIFNYPNPFSVKTNFQFEHNRPGDELTIEINIFDINGRIVTTINEKVNGKGNKVSNIEWDGRTSSGAAIGSGAYIYRILVTTSDGQQVQHTERLVYIK